nr:vitellogenin 2 [Dermanyssus gallinae]
MRVLLTFVALAVAVSAAAYHGQKQVVIPDLFEGQREYVYNYRSLVATGLPLQSQRFAGLEKYGILTVQVHEQHGTTKVLGLRLGHVTSGSFDKEVEDVENRGIEGISPHSIKEIVEKYGAVFVTIQDNEVQKIKVPQGMPEEIVNIYRGIAALFTVGKPDTHVHGSESHPFTYQGEHGEQLPVVYRRQEKGIAGNFETTYEILSNPEHEYGYLNVTKTRNYLKKVGPDGRFFQNGHDAHGCGPVCLTHKPEQIDQNMQPDTTAWETPVTEGCPVKFHPKKDLVEAFTTYNYNMTVEQGGKIAVIHEAKGLDKKVLPLRKQQILTVSLLKVTLVEVRPISQIWEEKAATKQYSDITYRFPEGHKHDLAYLSLYSKGSKGEIVTEQILPMLKALSKIIVSDNIELKSQTGDKVVQLTQALGVLTKTELQSIWTVIGEPVSKKTATEFEKVQRKVLVDIIALSGSNDAAEFLVELIQQERLTVLETVHTLETLQKSIVKPTLTIIKQLLNVCTETKFQKTRVVFSTACIAFSEIVRHNCEDYVVSQMTEAPKMQGEEKKHTVHSCGPHEYKAFIETIREKLYAAQEYPQQVVYIQVLGRLAHPEALKALVPYIYGEHEVIAQVEKMTRDNEHEDNSEYVQFLRQVAIFALHHSVRKHGASVQPIVQGVYFNKKEDYELRIAALSVLLATQPTEATFGRIVTELYKEDNLEIASYTYSALHALANSTLPCMKQSARRVQNVLGAFPKKSYGIDYSKWGTHTKYSPLMNFGYKGHWEITQSNVSAIPRAIYVGATANKGPFISTLGEFGMISKGLENLDRFVGQKGGVQKIMENVMQRIRRDARTFVGDASVGRMLEEIENAFDFNTEENNEQLRAVVFGNVLGNEFYLPVDKQFVTKVAEKVGEEMIKILREEGSEKTLRYVRVLLPRTYVQVAPAVNGLPVLMINRHPIVVSLALKDLKIRLGAEKEELTLNPLTFAASGLIQPTVYFTAFHTAMTINPLETSHVGYGLRTIEQTYMSLPIDASIQYTHQTKTLAFTFRPRFEKIFFHKTRAMTFKTEVLLISDVERPILDQYTVIKTQRKPYAIDRVFGEKLGMALRVQGLTVNENYADNLIYKIFTGQHTAVTSILKGIANEWVLPRAWTVRIEQNKQTPIDKVKVVLRLGDYLKDRMLTEQTEQKQLKQQRLTQEQLVKEQAYPEYLRMIAYEDEYEKVTGRKPATEKIEQALQRIVKTTEKHWSQIEPELREKLNVNNAQVRSIEYIITAIGQKKQPIAITGHAILASTPSKQARLAELTVDVEKHPISFEMQAVSAFAKAPQPFKAEIREQDQRGILGFVAQLETPKIGKKQYAGKIEMTKSEEQKQLMKRSIQQQPWYYRQCEEDKKEYTSEMSSACTRTRYHKSALNRVYAEIELPEEIPQPIYNISRIIRDTLKVKLYGNLHATYNRKDMQQNKLQVELVYIDRFPAMHVANLTIRTPVNEELHFERIALPKALRPNSMWTLKEQIKAFLKNNRPEPVCVYNGKVIRTFDNVTVSLDTVKVGQKYLVARDNDEQSKFSIVATKVQAAEESQTVLEVLLRDATLIKLVPSVQKGVYKVHVNQTVTEVTPHKVQVYQYGPWAKHMLTLHVEEHKEGQDTLVVKVRDMHVHIVYDGKNFLIEIAGPQIKGQLTGLCGDLNHQHIDELTGPRGCHYEREEDFVRAFSFVPETNVAIEGEWVCPEGVHPRAASQMQISKKMEQQQAAQQKKQLNIQQRQIVREEYNKMTPETKMIHQDGKVCYSVDPVQACKPGLRAVETEMHTVAFVCLPIQHPMTAMIQREIQVHGVIRNIPSVMPGALEHILYHQIKTPISCAN